MKLNNLEFLETLEQDSQVCGGDSDSDVDVDVDVDSMIDGDIDIIELDSANLSYREDVTVIVNHGWVEFGYYDPIY